MASILEDREKRHFLEQHIWNQETFCTHCGKPLQVVEIPNPDDKPKDAAKRFDAFTGLPNQEFVDTAQLRFFACERFGRNAFTRLEAFTSRGYWDSELDGPHSWYWQGAKRRHWWNFQPTRLVPR